MKKAVLGLLIASFMFASGKSLAVPGSLPEYGYQTIRETWDQLIYYGLMKLDAWDPSLPKPQVPAIKAVVSKRLGLVAYYDEETGFVETTLVFKNPDGSQRHSVSFNKDNIKFVTPNQGTVANANMYSTPNGPAYNFYCQSRPVTEQSFYECVDRLFVRVIVEKLRKYAY